MHCIGLQNIECLDFYDVSLNLLFFLEFHHLMFKLRRRSFMLHARLLSLRAIPSFGASEFMFGYNTADTVAKHRRSKWAVK